MKLARYEITVLFVNGKYVHRLSAFMHMQFQFPLTIFFIQFYYLFIPTPHAWHL